MADERAQGVPCGEVCAARALLMLLLCCCAAAPFPSPVSGCGSGTALLPAAPSVKCADHPWPARPCTRPQGWLQFWDHAEESHYYHHPATGRTSWEPPAAAGAPHAEGPASAQRGSVRERLQRERERRERMQAAAYTGEAPPVAPAGGAGAPGAGAPSETATAAEGNGSTHAASAQGGLGSPPGPPSGQPAAVPAPAHGPAAAHTGYAYHDGYDWDAYARVYGYEHARARGGRLRECVCASVCACWPTASAPPRGAGAGPPARLTPRVRPQPPLGLPCLLGLLLGNVGGGGGCGQPPRSSSARACYGWRQRQPGRA